MLLYQYEHIMRDVTTRLVILDILHSNGSIILFYLCLYTL